MTSGHPQYFADVVQARRKQLKLSMAAVHAAGGPSVPTVGQAERGALGNPKQMIFSRFDAGLQWVPGSAAAAYQEGRPPVGLEAKEPPAPATPLRFGGSDVTVPLDRLIELLAVQRDLNVFADSGRDLPAARLQDIATRLNREVSLIVGMWSTDMLERNRDQDATHPGLQAVFGDALSMPVDPDEPEAEERLYRRWLLGGATAAGLGEELHRKFELRYRQQQGGDLDAEK